MVATKPNAAIFILSQNTEARRVYLKTCLYFLFRHFNAAYRYPVVIFHEGDYDTKSQREIIMGIREECRDLVSFMALDPTDFVVPDHIDKVKMERCIAMRPTPYWRNDKYRLMCRWWIVCMPKYAVGYDCVMRLDDDSIIEEPIKQDLFAWFMEKELIYAGNLIHQDCGLCCYGMRDFFLAEYPDKKGVIDGIFTESELPMTAMQMHPFRAVLSITGACGGGDIPEKLKIHSPTMFFNNYHITRSDFWQRKEVKEICEKFDKNGGWAYYRWGDSPIQSIIVMLHARPDQISSTKFKYSKRLQREAFVGETAAGAREVFPYMPARYSESSCMTERAELGEITERNEGK